MLADKPLQVYYSKKKQAKGMQDRKEGGQEAEEEKL